MIGAYLTIITLIVNVYYFKVEKMTKNGIEEYTKWKAFENFLLDFSKLKDYPLPSIVIWEHYLVYATTFGIAEKVLKNLTLKLNFTLNDTSNILEGHSHFFDSFNSISNSIRINYNNSASLTKISSGSSSSGFSGGSSSGGGGGSFGGR